jgi:hypothetical protein
MDFSRRSVRVSMKDKISNRIIRENGFENYGMDGLDTSKQSQTTDDPKNYSDGCYQEGGM